MPYPKGTRNREARWDGHPSLVCQETDRPGVKDKNTPQQESVKERAAAGERHLFLWTVSSDTKDSRVHGGLGKSNSSFHKLFLDGAC